MKDDIEKTVSGHFASNFFSLQLQLKTLLEDAGGEEVVRFLDSLCKLQKSEQKIVLNMFSRTIDRFIGNDDVRLSSNDDRMLKNFEETLYRDILDSMRSAAGIEDKTEKKFSVLDGGRTPFPKRRAKTPLQLAEYRKEKHASKLN